LSQKEAKIVLSHRLQNLKNIQRAQNLWVRWEKCRRLNEILVAFFGENHVDISDIIIEKNEYVGQLSRFQANSILAKETESNIEMLNEALALRETLKLTNTVQISVQGDKNATAKASSFPPSAPMDENQNIPSSNEGYDLPQPPVNATAVDNGQDDQSMNLKDLVGTYDFVKAPRTAEAIILAMLGNIASLQANEIVRIQIPEAFRCAASSRVSELEKRL
jgi:hypothetical protein